MEKQLTEKQEKEWGDLKIWCIRNKVAMSEKLEEMIKEVMKK